MPALVFFRRGVEVLRVGLEQRRVVIGRGAQCDVVIPDSQVSRQQVALRFDGTRCLMENLSSQGTRVCGEFMSQGELPDGGTLELGPWRALYRERVTAVNERPTVSRSLTDVQASEALRESLPQVQVRVRQGANEFLHQVKSDRFTVGKAPTNAVVIEDPSISNHHLEVTRLATGFLVRDLDSTNGTFQGSTRLVEAEVALNNALRLGETALVFEPVSRAGRPGPTDGLIGKSPAMRELADLIQRVAPSNATVTILGESGTGKEMVARALHARSERASQPFIPVNCAALSPALMESELFGHERGAFTGADAKRAGAFVEAHRGTLFLDEVGELPLELQAKLLRALEGGEIKPVGASRPFHVDARVLVATNRDLSAEVRQGRFREDLYYRLSVMPLVLPPLRERRGDIRLLAEYFLRVHSPSEVTVKFTPEALALLQRHPWPGNVRELRNLVHRALMLRKGTELGPRDIVFTQTPDDIAPKKRALVLEVQEGLPLEQMLRLLERQIIEGTLRSLNNHREQTARTLGLARSSLFKRLKQWGYTQEEGEAP